MFRRRMRRAAATTAVVAGTAAAASGVPNSRQPANAQPESQANQQQAPPDAQQAAPDAAPPLPAPVAGGLAPEAVEQLQSLAALRDQGVLTEEEFAAQKAKILG